MKIAIFFIEKQYNFFVGFSVTSEKNNKEKDIVIPIPKVDRHSLSWG